MHIQQIIRIYIILTIFIVASTLASGFYTQNFLDSQTEFRAVVTGGETPENIIAACKQLHQPIAARTFPIFSLLSLLSVLCGIALIVITFRYLSVKQSIFWIVFGTTFASMIIYFIVQLWEPDYLLAVCGL